MDLFYMSDQNNNKTNIEEKSPDSESIEGRIKNIEEIIEKTKEEIEEIKKRNNKIRNISLHQKSKKDARSNKNQENKNQEIKDQEINNETLDSARLLALASDDTDSSASSLAESDQSSCDIDEDRMILFTINGVRISMSSLVMIISLYVVFVTFNGSQSMTGEFRYLYYGFFLVWIFIWCIKMAKTVIKDNKKFKK